MKWTEALAGVQARSAQNLAQQYLHQHKQAQLEFKLEVQRLNSKCKSTSAWSANVRRSGVCLEFKLEVQELQRLDSKRKRKAQWSMVESLWCMRRGWRKSSRISTRKTTTSPTISFTTTAITTTNIYISIQFSPAWKGAKPFHFWNWRCFCFCFADWLINWHCHSLIWNIYEEWNWKRRKRKKINKKRYI